ncbi:hypothetical protein [Carnobacterium divergens]|uniref:hypothetical protein n=1 Tax=Carnobacterium divergens TaxID=2748 RepID=UPI0039AF4729
MTNYEKKEEHAIEKIADTLLKLEKTLSKLDSTENKVTVFIEQEKAIHEIKKIVKEAKKIDKLNDKELEKEEKRDIASIEKSQVALADIEKNFDHLDRTLEKLDDSNTRVKSYVEQEKAIHEAKKILKSIDKYNVL